jgi:FAD/FMN-containing dehydrogenase
LSADVVTADGRLAHASAQENSDLFWAIRGGGGNFGVVTSFEFRLHDISSKLVGGHLVFPFAQARQVLAGIAEYSLEAPDEFWIDPVLESDAGGERRLLVNVCHCGDRRAAANDLAVLRKLGDPVSDTVGARPFVVLQSEQDADSPHGRGYYMSGGLVQALTPALLDHAVDSMKLPGAELGKISLTQHGGCIARVPVDATAFANRTASHNIVLRASWDDPAQAPAKTAWQKNTWKGFEPFMRGAYANLSQGAAADPKLIGAYGPNLTRLADLKTKFDPKNLFHLNPNIKPRTPSAAV